ncbi:MAG TPA: hypothetical protein ENK19_02500 [Acidobacteria bacterium]|nr:hypothetical protein [Acidobacteriota bacterium]
MSETTDLAGRAPVVAAVLEARQRLAVAMKDLDRSTEEDSEAEARYDEALETLERAETAYEAWLPRLLVSRCPLTGHTYRMAIDTGGIDGPWWDSEQPVRPAEPRPTTWFALAGAMLINGKPPATPFTVLPGPGAPWVCPRLLRLPGVRAVISRITVGPYPAYPIVYFSQDPHPGVRRLDTWGTHEHVAASSNGDPMIASSYPVRSDYDFDLAPWIASGRLLWIAPGDRNLELHATSDGCPFLNLPGRREPVMLRRGSMKSILIELPDHATEES